MIDKIEAMIERGTHLRGGLEDLTKISPYDPTNTFMRPSKFYWAVADLRSMGYPVMLHLQQKRYGTHKVEMLETGKRGMAELHAVLESIVDADPDDCRLGRVDLAADVPGVSVSWFRNHSYVQYKQFICAHWKHIDEENSEMGKKLYHGLYFGKRPSCIRVYNKVEERISHFELWKRRELRFARKGWKEQVQKEGVDTVGPLLLPVFPSTADWLKGQLSDMTISPVGSFPVLTRVENQYGGRVPGTLHNFGELKKNVLDFNPFDRMKLLTGKVVPPSLFDCDERKRYRFRVQTWMAFMWVRENWDTLGAAQMWSYLNRDRHGRLYLKQMREFLPVVDDDSPGITESELYDRYRTSMSRQLAA